MSLGLRCEPARYSARGRLAAALLFVSSAAAAEPAVPPEASAAGTAASLSFEWRAPLGCPVRAEVLARAEHLIGHSLTRTSSTRPITLLATVLPLDDTTWRLDVSSDSQGASGRAVTAPSCDELADAMALLIALSIDPDYAARQKSTPLAATAQSAFPDVPREPVVVATPAPAPPIASTRPVASARLAAPRARSAAPLHVAVGALGALWADRLPNAAPGGVLRGALSLRKLAFDVELGLFPTQHVAAPGGAGDLWLGTFGGSLGYAVFDGLLTPHAGFELDLLHGAGSGLRHPDSGTIWLLGLDAGLLVRYPVQQSIHLLVAGDLSFLPEQARFHIDPNVDLFQPSRVGARFGLGAEMTIR